jgi:Recombination endonuclease VII
VMRKVKKRCSKCGTDKLLIEFSESVETPDGLFSWCKSCQRVYLRQRRHTTVEPDPLTNKILQRVHLERHEKRLQARKRSRLLHMYGITPQQHDQMLEAQGYLCALCGCELTADAVPSVDHSHETDIIRGIVCRKCNLMIGLAEDDPKLLYLGIKYLRESE